MKSRTHCGSESPYQVLVVKTPLRCAYQYTGWMPRPMGRMAPRSLRETESTRVRWSASVIQSVSVLPSNRNGEAPTPSACSSGASEVFTPTPLAWIPVL